MPSNGGRINFQVGLTTDKSSFTQLKNSLKDLQNIKITSFDGTAQELKEIKNTAAQVDKALEQAFNVNLNSVNIGTFNEQLKKASLSVDQIYSSFSKAGTQGQVAFSKMAGQVLTTNLKLKETHSILNDMGTTMMNTIKWGIASSIMNNFTNSVHSAFSYVKNLEASLTDIRIVTGDSQEKMDQFAASANKAAQALGRSTMDYTKSALTFYQQGLSDEDVAARTQATLKAQNITGAGAEMADYLTAVWNGYKVANEQAELYVDKLAAVADSSASDMGQLATAMSKVAATANNMGVDVDSLNAQLATVIATTKQAPESVGTAFKTIYSRINDIATGADDAEVSLGRYSERMASLGFNVLDANGRLRDTQEVIEQIGGSWENLSKEQQIYLAQTMGGQRQITQIMALFDNWNVYTQLLNTSLESQGTLTEKNGRYMESLGAKMEQLGSAQERVKSALINEDDLAGLIDALGQGVNYLGSFIESIGGGTNALLALESIATRVFSKIIANEINNFITNIQNARNNVETLKQDIQQTEVFGKSQGYTQGIINKMVDMKKEIQPFYDVMNQSEINAYNAIVKQVGELKNQQLILKKNEESAKAFTAALQQNVNEGADLNDQFLYVNERAEQLGKTLNSLKGKNLLDLWNNPSVEVFDKIEAAVTDLKLVIGDETIPVFRDFDQILEEITSDGDITEQQLIRFKKIAETIFSQVYEQNGLAINIDEIRQKLNLTAEQMELVKRKAGEIRGNKEQLFATQNVVKFIGGLGQISTGLNNIVNLTKIWNNENMSLGEKIFQTFQNVIFTIPMIVTGLTSIITVKKLQTAADIQAATGKVIHTGAQTALNVALSEGALAAGRFTAALLTNPIFLAIAAITALAAVVGVNLVKAWNAQADAAKHAAEVAQEAKSVYEQTKQSYEDLKKSIEELKSVQDSMSNLTKGTQEWNQALNDANNKVLELIENFPELANQVETTSDGLLKIQDGALDQLQKNEQQKTLISGLVYARNQKDSAQAERASLITNASREISGIDNSTLTKIVDVIEDNGIYLLHQTDKLAELADITDEQKQAVKENTPQIQKLIVEINKNATAADVLSQNLTKSLLEDSKQYQSSSQPQVFAKMLENRLKNIEIDADAYNMDGDLIAKRYQALTGKETEADWQALESVNNYKIKDANGQWKEVSQDVVEDFVALADAMEKSGDIQKEINQTISQIEKDFGDSADIAFNFINGFSEIDFTKLSEDDIDKMKEKIAELAKYIPDTTEEEISQNLDSLKENIKQGWDDLFSDQEMINPVKGAIESLKGDNGLTLSAAQAIKDSLLEAYKQGGQEAVDQLHDFYATIKPEDFDALKEVSSTFNFTNASAQDFKKALDQAGIATDASTESINAYIEAQKKQVQEMATPEETYKKIHDAIDGFKDGSKEILSEDDITALKQAGIQLDEYFTHMADGTLKIKGDATEFYEYANGISLQGFSKEIDRIQTQLNNINTFTQNSYSPQNGGKWQNFSGVATSNEQLSAQLQFLYAIEGETGKIAQIRNKMSNGQKASTQELNYISKQLQTHRQEYQDINSVQQRLNNQLKIYQEELSNTNEQENIPKIDENVNEEQLNQLSEYLQQYADQIDGVNESLKDNKQDCDDVAEAILRYDSALAQIIDNYDKWQTALTTGSLQQQIQATKELSNAYADLLNLEPGQKLSEDFLKSTENLQLFKQASEGSEQAYNELVKRAQEDTLQVNFDLQRFKQDRDNIYGMIQDIYSQEFPDLQIGASLNDEKFLAALTEMIQNAHMTQQEAEKYLSNMGIDAEVVPETTTVQDQSQHSGVVPVPEELNGETTVSVPQATQPSFDGAFGGVFNSVVSAIQDVVLPFTAKGWKYQETAPTVVKNKNSMTALSLRVKSAKKKASSAGGSFKFKNASHGAGNAGTTARSNNSSKKSSTTPKKTSRKSSSPKKKSSNKSSKKKKTEEKDPDKMDQLKQQTNRYHDIDITLQKINIKLTRVQKQQKKLTGPDLIKNLNQQLQILKDQVEAYKQKIDLAKQEAKELKSRLAGYGTTFDQNGQITNYASVLEKYLNRVNNAIKHYNNLSAEQQKTYKDTVAARKQEYEEVKKLIDQYDKLTTNTIPGLEDSVTDALDNITNLNIEKFKIKVDIDLDLSEAIREWNNFEKQVINKIRDDDILGNVNAKIADFFSYYQGNNLIMSLTDQVQSTLDQLLDMDEQGLASVYGDNRAQAIEDLKKYSEDLMKNLEEVNSLIKQIKKSYFDMVNAAQSAFDEQVKEYDFLENLINHDKKLIEMLYGDQAYSQMSNYFQKQEDADKRELDFQRQQKDFWWAQMQAQKARMSSLDKQSNEYKEAEQRFKELEDHWMSAVNNFNSQVETSITNLLDKYNNSISIIFNDLGKKLTNGKGLDYVGEEWELINDQADDYLDKIDSMYQIQKLQKAYEDSIKENDGNLAAQQSLNNLMEQQLKMLKDKDRLTQYDIDRANMLLQIEMKRIALEQKQQSKSKLRLRRDSQGNYTYQYVSDTQEIAEAQQSLAEAQNELYNLDKTTYRKNLNDIYSIQTNFNQKMQELYQEYPVWTEQAQMKRKLLVEKYEDSINNLVNDNQEVRLNLMDSTFQSLAYMYDTDVDNFINMSRAEQDELMNSLIPEWNSGIQEMTDTIAGKGGLIPVCQDAFDDLQRNTQEYEDTLDELQQIAQVNFDELADGLDTNIEKTEDLIDLNDELIQKYSDEMTAIDKVISQIEKLTKKYNQAEKAAIAATTQAYKYWQQEQKNTAISASRSKSSSRSSSSKTSTGSGSGGGYSSSRSTSSGSSSNSSSSKSKTSSTKKSSSKKGSGNGKPQVGDTVTYVSGKYHEDSYGSGRSGSQSRGKKVTISKIASGHPYPIHIRNSSTALGWVKKSQIQGYDTGGYTGAWGTNGRIGILHEKEIVLNAKDTKNILAAVNIVRTMDELLKSVNSNIGTPNTLANVVFNRRNNSNGLDQNVYITANFPNVNSKIQIEAAFNNLINRANQYVHTNKR